jgi:hypothetical protein
MVSVQYYDISGQRAISANGCARGDVSGPKTMGIHAHFNAVIIFVDPAKRGGAHRSTFTFGDNNENNIPENTASYHEKSVQQSG